MKPVPAYKTAEELGITQEERDGLSKAVTDLLDMNQEDFSMRNWSQCICGVLGKYVDQSKLRSVNLERLFIPFISSECWAHCRNASDKLDDAALARKAWDAKPDEAAMAVVHFLMHGT